jgi:site-specific DNA recombinase
LKAISKKSLSTGIYVRVSTEEQAQEGFSIRGQMEKLKTYALLKEWDIYDIYADEGISGKNIVDRPAINRLMADVESGKINNVLVFKVDRLTRSTKNLLELVELFEEYNCTFNSLTESIDTDSPSGRMFLKIIGIFAEFERENLIARVKMGLERKVKEGYTIANHSISYGYYKEPKQRVQNVHLEEAEIIKEIFSLYAYQNYSMNRIAQELNLREIPTKTGVSWGSATIRAILVNPTYIGKVRYAMEDKSRYFTADGQHEPIISDEVFRDTQQRIESTTSHTRTKLPKERSYFCGVLYCGRCGCKFTTQNYTYKTAKSDKNYKSSYICRTRKDRSINQCTNPNITHWKVEIAFCEYIQNINDITETADLIAIETANSAEQELLKSIVACEKKLKNLQTRKNQVMEQYVQGAIEYDEYKILIKKFNKNFEKLEDELQRKKTKLSNLKITPKIINEDVILNLKENWNYLTNTEKMIFLRRFVKKIIITVEKQSYNSSSVNIDSVEFNYA